MDFANKLKAAREKAGLSQTQVAAKLCITPQAISRWEHGKAEPNLETLSILTKLYNVKADDLL